jgi:hypothetical protein
MGLETAAFQLLKSRTSILKSNIPNLWHAVSIAEWRATIKEQSIYRQMPSAQRCAVDGP